MKYRITAALLLGSTSWLVGCSSPVPEDALAVWKSGSTSPAELEERVLRLPPEERRPADGDFGTWYADLVREAAVEEILASEAEAQGLLDTESARRSLAEGTEEILAGEYLRRYLPSVPRVTEEEVRELFDRRRDRWHREEQRLVLHIFLRPDENLPVEAREADLRDRLSQLRERVLAGDGFTRVARLSSQSESRHRDGVLGTFRRGQLAPSLEEVIFGLPAELPSQPFLTPQGGHLFWVERIVRARDFEFDEVARDLAEELQRERRDEAIDELLAAVELPADSFVPTPDELRVLLEAGDGAALALRIGNLELDLAALIERAEENREGGPGIEGLHRLVSQLVQRHRAATLAVEEGLDDEPLVRAQVEELRRREAAREGAWDRMRTLALEDAADLEAFYQNHQLRYAEPLRLRLSRLVVPVDSATQGLAAARRLEQAAAGVEVDLENLAAQLDGRVVPLSWIGFDVLQRMEPRAAELVAPLHAGQLSPPFRTIEGVNALRVEERRDPQPRPFEVVREQVLEDYLAQRGPELYRLAVDDLLEAVDFRLRADRVAALVD